MTASSSTKQTTNFETSLEEFAKLLENPQLPPGYTRVPSRSRIGKMSYRHTSGNVYNVFPMNNKMLCLMKEAAYAFYVSEFLLESTSIEGMKVMDLEYNGEMEDSLYELVKKEMKRDQYMCKEQQKSYFESWTRSREEERISKLVVPCAEEVPETMSTSDSGGRAVAVAVAPSSTVKKLNQHQSDSSSSSESNED
jgi:hypothetical protein